MTGKYHDRSEAGRILAWHLRSYANRSDVLVLALPRGGVPVAYEVAQNLHVPMDVFLVRKLGVPGQEELAMGAIATGGVRVLNQSVIDGLGISDEAIEQVAAREQRELERRERVYRGDHPLPSISGRTAILVDDGLATGATMRAAAAAVRQQGPTRTAIAVPVGAAETCEDLRRDVDEVVCPLTPEPFYAIGLWYEDFSQTSDDEVRDLLHRVQTQQHAGA